MTFIKNMTKREFTRLPKYDRNNLEAGKSYRLFGHGLNPKCNTAYIKTILEITEDKVKSTINEIHFED